ncbi:MAG TPA: hypothetical protein VGJ84_02550 [Polyangiaceae bacterium]
MRTLGKSLIFAQALLVFTGGATARAQTAPSADPTDEPAITQASVPADKRTRDQARDMSRQALELMKKERWAEAESLLSQAYRLVPAPTIALLHARALEKLDKLIEARERYRAVVATQLPKGAPSAFRSALKEAGEELKSLEPEIPRLVLVLAPKPANGTELDITLDGKRVSNEELGQPRFANPGEHLVLAAVQGRVLVENRIRIARGESKEVVLSLAQRPAGVAPERPKPPPIERPSVAAPNHTASFIALGAGAAGLSVGVVAGVIMLDAKSTLDKKCKPLCPAELSSEVSRFRTARAVSTVGYITGAVGLGVGAALLLFNRAGAEPTGGAAVGLWADGQVIGLAGSL